MKRLKTIVKYNMVIARFLTVFVLVGAGVLVSQKVIEIEASGNAPVAYYKFDEGTGTTINSSAGTNNTGALTSTTWQTEDMCLSGKCLNYNGSTSYVTIANGTIPSQNGSVSVWVRPTVYNNGYNDVLSIGSGGNDFRITFESNNQSLYGFFIGGEYRAQTSTNPPLNTWTHVEVVWDSSGTRVYYNGIFQAQNTSAPPAFSNTGVYLGTYGYDITSMYSGNIDELKIYNYARTPAQILMDYNAKSASTSKGASALMATNTTDPLNKGMIGYWKMDESSGNAADSSGMGTTLTNSNATFAAGKFGNAGVFNGTNAQFYSTAAGYDNLSQLTLSEWVYVNSTSDWERVIFNKGVNDSTPSHDGYVLAFDNTVGGRKIMCTLSNGTSEGTARTDAAFTLTSWHLVTCTYDGQKVRLYIDGAKQTSEGNLSGTINNLNDTTYPLRLGADNSGGALFAGNADEVRIYNRALSGAEIRQLYNFAPGPKGYWRFEEGSGGTVYDSSGNGRSLTWSNQLTGVNHYAPGKFGLAGNFNGSNDGASVGSVTMARTTNITMEAWVYWRSTSQAAQIMYNGNAGSSGYGIWVGNGSGGAGARVNVLLGGLSWDALSNSTYNLPTNQWTHLAVVRGSATWYLYVNGVLTLSGGSTAPNTPAGSTSISSSPTSSFNGLIDEVKFYDYPRSQDQVMEDMNGRTGSTTSLQGVSSSGKGAVGYWKMDEGYGTKIYDSSGRANTGTLGGNTGSAAYPTWAYGKFGQALNFNGTSNFVSMFYDDKALRMDQSKSMTFSLWLNPSAFGSQRDFLIYSDADLDDGDNNWSGISQIRLWLDAGGTVTFFYGPSPWTSVTSTQALTTGSWYHVVAVRNVAADNQCIYINGKLDKCATDTTTGTWETTGQYMMLGRYKDNSSSEYYKGMMDEVKVYDYALTQDEVNLEYNRGAAVILGAVSDTSQLSGGTAASQSASARYCVPGSSASCAVPVGEWNFEEASGTTLNDVGSGGNAGTWYGNGVHRGPGLSGWAGQFNGDTDYVDLGNKTAFAIGTAATFEVWVYPTKLQDGFFFNKWTNGAEDKQLTLVSAGNVQLYLHNVSGGGVLTSRSKPPLNKWSHVVGVYDGSKEYIYINGVLDNWQNASGDVADSTGSMYFGKNPGRSVPNGGPKPFAGRLDKILFFNYARSPAQIAWDYNQGAPMGWWKFNECSGTTLNDSISATNSATLTLGGTAGTCTDGTNTTNWSKGQSGAYNGSLYFSGTTDNAAVTTALNYVQSVSFWAKPDSAAQSYLQLNAGTYISTDSNGTVTATGFSSPTIYVNGKVNGTVTAGQWNHILVTTASGISASAIKFGVQNSTYYAGRLDEVKIWTYPLTETQVNIDYNQGSAVRFAQ